MTDKALADATRYIETVRQLANQEGDHGKQRICETILAALSPHATETGDAVERFMAALPAWMPAGHADEARKAFLAAIATTPADDGRTALLRDAQAAFALLELPWRGSSTNRELTEEQWTQIGEVKSRIDAELNKERNT